MKVPNRGELFTAEIDRISHSGNGFVDFHDGHVNIGPVSKDSEGEKIRGVMIRERIARCRTESVKPDDYDVRFNELVDPSKKHSQLKETPKKGEIFRAEVDRISNSGNGIIEFKDGSINIGPVTKITVGKRVQVEVVENGFGYCKKKRGKVYNYDLKFDKMLENSSDVTDVNSENKDMSASEVNKSKNEIDKLEVLREKAEKNATQNVHQDSIKSSSSVQEYTRSKEVTDYVKARADGFCEGCREPAPFTNKNGEPYLHAHHIYELSDGGSDTPDTVIALCPNCHFQVHHGENGEEYNNKLREKINRIEG